MSRRIFLFSLLVALSTNSLAWEDYDVLHGSTFTPHMDTLTVMVIGDVMMHAKQLEYPYDNFLKEIKGRLSDADFAIANMEFSLGGPPYSGYPEFCTPDSFADYAASCGINVFLTANNHILDRGSAGLTRTLERYRAMGERVKFTGTASDMSEKKDNYPLLIEKKGMRIALINFTYGTNVNSKSQWPAVNRTDTTDIKAAFERARESKADYIVALPHWGEEYKLHHSERQGRLAEWLIGQGADAIIGAHPHVVQDSSHIAGKPVIYSVGNAISNMSAPNTRLELAVSLRFVRNFFTGETRMLEPELEFMWCTLPGRLTDSYCTIFVDEWQSREADWMYREDYRNMMTTLERVKKETGIQQ